MKLGVRVGQQEPRSTNSRKSAWLADLSGLAQWPVHVVRVHTRVKGCADLPLFGGIAPLKFENRLWSNSKLPHSYFVICASRLKHLGFDRRHELRKG